MTRTPPLPATAPVILAPVFGRGGRWLADLRPYWGPYGWIYQWTVEDMDSDGHERTGLVLDCAAASLVTNYDIFTAILGPDGLAKAPAA